MELPIERGATPITLDRPRVIFFDHRAAFFIHQRYGAQFLTALYELKDGKVILKDPEVLPFFLWAGLLRDARDHGEELTLDAVETLVTPFNIGAIFNRLLIALNGTILTKRPEGKALAAESPVAAAAEGPGPALVTTSMRRSPSRSAPSAGRSKPTGSPR